MLVAIRNERVTRPLAFREVFSFLQRMHTSVKLGSPYLILVGDTKDSGFNRSERRSYLAALKEETGLPCVDSAIDGCGEVAELMTAASDRIPRHGGS